MITVVIVAGIFAGWLAVCLGTASVMGGDTRRREHEATHALAYEKRLAVYEGAVRDA